LKDECGSGTHPDSVLFIQVCRLLSTYLLVRPPRGSNVSEETLLKAIVSMKDIIVRENHEHKRDLKEKIDNILDNEDILMH